MKPWKVARAATRVARASSAAKDPVAYAKRRARSRALGAAGVWSIVAKLRGR